MSEKKLAPGRVLLIAHRSRPQHQARALLVDAGFEVLTDEGSGNGQPLDVILVQAEGEEFHFDRLAALDGAGDYPPPIVVFGPERGRKWRRLSLEAGAFGCLSNSARRDDKLGLIGAACRFRALQREIELIRSEADIVMQELLTTYGSEAQKLQKVVREAKSVKESLQDVQNRIIRSML